MNNTMKRYLLPLVISFYFLCYIISLGVPGLFVPDETRYAEVPREMIASGDWVVPHINGLRYFEKPVFGYWIHAASILIFGENNFAVRLPSAISVGLSAFLLFLMVRIVKGSENNEKDYTAIVAPLIFLSCFGVFAIGNVAVLDNLFSFFLTATIGMLYFATEQHTGSSREKYLLILSGITCGLAFLTKGFLAFAIPVITIAPYLIWERRYRDLIRMCWLPILVAVLIVLPWGILINMREPDYWRFFFWNEHIRRFIENNAQHKESFWFFFKAAPGMFMPWTFLIPAAVSGLMPLFNNKYSQQNRILRFSICWLVLPFLFFSASGGKLLTYIIPCFPPFVILMFFGLENVLKEGQSKIFKWGASGTGIFFGLILFALVYIQLFDFNGFHPFRQPWKAIMFINSMIAFLIFCFWSVKSSKTFNKILLIGLSPFLFFFIIHYIVPDLALIKKVPGILLEKHKNLSNDTVVIADNKTLTAACWYLRRNNIYLLEDGGELNYGLAYPYATHRLLDLKSVAGFIKGNMGRTLLIARVKNIEKWKDQLPDPVYRDMSGPEGYVLLRY
jgi:4-amino-4-deoxy-L-arabinose transferase